MRSNIIDRVSFLSLFLLVVLLPVFLLPFTAISVETSKNLFLVSGLIVAVICWIASRFSDGVVSLPRSLPLILGGGGIVVATLLSAIFSGASGVTFFGNMLDIGSFWFILSAVLLMLLSSIVFKDAKSARLLLFGVIGSSILLLVFQLLHTFMPGILSLGVLSGKTSTILGSWNSFGIFTGFFIVASVFINEFFPVTREMKIGLGVFTALALFMVSMINFVFIWEIIGIFTLLIFIYKISINLTKETENRKIHFPIFSFVVIMVSLFFFMSAGLFGGYLPTKFGTINNEVSPSIAATMSVTKGVIKNDPVFGLGPNRFGEAWALHKPAVINNTIFWDVAFNSGSGLITTLTATTGILGILAWVTFFVLFVVAGFKSIFSGIKNNINIEAVLFFFLSLYLFVASLLYFTGAVVFLLAFAFAGVFIALVAVGKPKGEISFSFFEDHRKSFFFMFFLIILMIVSIAIGFKYIQRFVSISYLAKTLQAQKIEDAQVSISNALRLNSNDLYLRTYSQVYLVKLNTLVSEVKGELTEAQKAELQATLDQAINGAQAAISYNPTNHLNYEMLGSVFQTAGLMGTKDAYARAVEAHQKAAVFNPSSPRIPLTIANIYVIEKKNKEAKEYANKALTMKPDFVDALIILSRIAKSEGNNSEALSYAQRALAILPTNADLIKYVDSLKNTSVPVNTNTTTEGEN